MTDREKFEEWAARYYDLGMYKGDYIFTETECAWDAWQAATEAAKPQWIKCSDQLPDVDYGYFLVTRIYNDGKSEPHVRYSFFTKDREQSRRSMPYYSRKTQDKNSVHFDAAELGFIVTHWMPLPDAPK